MQRPRYILGLKIMCSAITAVLILSSLVPLMSSGTGNTLTNTAQTSTGGISTASNFNSTNQVTKTLFLLNGTVINGNYQNSTSLTISPIAAAYDPANNYLYVTESSLSSVAVINATSLRFVGNISLASGSFGILYDPLDGNIYTTNEGVSTVSVINASTNTVSATISGFTGPYGISCDPVTGNIYVANYGSSTGNVSILDPANNTIIGSVNVGSNPQALAYDPLTNSMLSVNSGSGNLTVINTTTNKMTAGISAGSSPDGIVYDPASQNFYVSNDGSDSVTIVNASTYAVVNTVSAGNSPYPAAYDPVNGYIYVPDFSSSVTVINGQTNTVLGSIPAGLGPYDAAFGSQTASMYIVNFYSQSISVIPTAGSAATYSVTFSETGLPSGHGWYVELSNGLLSSSTTSTASFSLPNGTYGYVAVNNNTGSYNTPGGNFTVDGGDVTISVVFASSNYSVTFRETGLTTGTIWNISFYGSSSVVSISGSYFSMAVSPGTYRFNASASGFNTISSQFTLKSSNVTVYLNFTASKTKYRIQLNEVGLPSGSGWVVYLNNGELINTSATSMIFYLQDGSYTYKTTDTGGMYEISGSSFVVNGSNMNITVEFAYGPSIQFHITPPNATLYLNGERINTTFGNASLSPSPGDYYVNVSMPGYQTYSDQYSFLAGHSYFTNITLKAITSSGYLNGTVSPANATITANGMPVPVEGGNFSDSLSPGSYYISATASGYIPVFREINISSGRSTFLNLALNSSGNITFSVSGYVSPANASVLFGEYSAYVNSTGYYHITLPGGTYTVSVVLNGYYPYVKNITVGSDITGLNITLVAEPPATSHTSSSNITATGYNVTVTNLTGGTGNISLTYNASANGTLSVVLPYSEVQNATISDLMNSQVYINGQRYYNFTVAVSTANGVYSVILTVTNLSGDPTLSWVYAPSPLQVYHPVDKLTKGLLEDILIVFVSAAVVAAVTAGFVWKKK